jgi:phage tail sheath protein FI
LIVRICGAGAAAARGTVGGLPLRAASVGSWGNSLEATIDLPAAGGDGFNLSIKDKATGANEIFRNLSMDVSAAGFVTKVLEQRSSLVGVDATEVSPATPVSGTQTLSGGADGSNISDDDISGPALESRMQGLWALEKADLFNFLCIPPRIPAGEIGRKTREAGANYCKTRRALFIVDPPASWALTGAAISGVGSLMTKTPDAAVFFPRLRASDPLKGGAIADFAPCGAVAGVMARTDATRGVWQAPAGLQATLEGVVGLSVGLTDDDIGSLNFLGVNCLRAMPAIGTVVWGARTFSDDAQYKYIPVRRLVLFIEESLTRGTKWVVFESNAEPLWAQIRTNVGAFLFSLFKQQAFQGLTPQDAYFVKCDGTTMT